MSFVPRAVVLQVLGSAAQDLKGEEALAEGWHRLAWAEYEGCPAYGAGLFRAGAAYPHKAKRRTTALSSVLFVN